MSAGQLPMWLVGLMEWARAVAPALLAVTAVLALVAIQLGLRCLQLGRRRRALAVDLRRATALAVDQRRLDHEVMLVNAYLLEFSVLLQEFIVNVELRRIPQLLVSTIQRMFGAEQAVMLVRRQASVADPDRGRRLVVAAVANRQREPRVGTEITIGEGHLGLVAESQQLMSRERATREIVGGIDPLPRFDLAAPLAIDQQVVGVIAYAEPSRSHRRNADILIMVAQLGAMAWHTVSAYRQAKVSADLDGLTGILNKGAVQRRLGELIVAGEAASEALAVFLFDIDHFKTYNDCNGHLAGDTVLRVLGQLVSDAVRSGDVFGRFGGEEFLLVMCGLRPSQAMLAATKVAAKIADHPFAHGARQPLGRLTVSGGVATYPEDGRSSVELIRLADEALYRAKEAGRNRVLRARTGINQLDP